MQMTPPLIHAYTLPAHIPPAALRGGVAVVIDQFRASTTICAALWAGARAVHPCLEPAEAVAMKAADPEVLLGGERSGVLIEGFDLGNSPWEYTAERVAGRTLAFTTTNGTKAVLHAREEGAARVLVGCLANVSALIESLEEEPRPVHLVCAGTREMATLEDCIAAGAIASRLALEGRGCAEDDTALALSLLYDGVMAEGVDLALVLRDGFGGRNLRREGLEEDIELCAVIDRYPVVPELDLVQGAFVHTGEAGGEHARF
jgi:2-phosphosulfolactate phosphatase